MGEVERAVVEKDEVTIQYLERMRKSGFLFHGTGNPDRIEIFEPRKASDPETEWNADTAVYASSEPVWSSIFALYKGKSSWSTSVTTDENGRIKSITARIPEKYRDQLLEEKGLVYVLPKDSFERQNGKSAQYKSKTAVKPISSVEVCLQDYYDMGGKIEWTSEVK